MINGLNETVPLSIKCASPTQFYGSFYLLDTASIKNVAGCKCGDLFFGLASTKKLKEVSVT